MQRSGSSFSGRAELQQWARMMDSLQIRIESDEVGDMMYLGGRLDMESSPHLRDQLLGPRGSMTASSERNHSAPTSGATRTFDIFDFDIFS